jgi:hypothetical protein
LLHLLPGLGIVSLNALRVRNCNFMTGLQFFALLPVCTALYSAALGAQASRSTYTAPRSWRVGLVCALAVGPLLLAAWRLYFYPPIFVYDHLWGFFAGSLYDETIAIDARLLWFRLGTCLRVGCLALYAVASATGWPQSAGQAPWWQRPAPRRFGLAAALLGCVYGYDAGVGSWALYRVGPAELRAALPLQVTRPHLVLHLPTGTPEPVQQALADDHAFRLAQLCAALQLAPPAEPLHSYIYASAAHKAQLMGGRNTMFTKPWLGEIHVHGLEVPHPVMPHELTHALMAPFGGRLLGVTARYGVLVNMGLVEGVAQAFTPPDADSPLSLQMLSRAMRDLHLSPDLAALLGPAGFWRQAPGRAYTEVGAFVQFLQATYGPAKLKQVYAEGDFLRVYQQDVGSLYRAWQRSLDGLQVPPREAQQAASLLATPSLFVRPCAHEIAFLQSQARAATPCAAVGLRRQVAAHLGNSPAALLDLCQALSNCASEAGQVEFLRLSAELLRPPMAGALTLRDRTQLQLLRAAGAWKQGDKVRAGAQLRAVQTQRVSPDQARSAWVWTWALQAPDPGLAAALRPFLLGELQGDAAIDVLRSQVTAHPTEPTLGYLLGRLLHTTARSTQDYGAAAAMLKTAGVHPLPLIEYERLRLRADCALQRRELDAACTLYAKSLVRAPTSGAVAQVNDWIERLGYLRGTPCTVEAK